MRFCLQLAARYCSILALTLSSQLCGPLGGNSAASAAQFGYGYDPAQYGAYGSPTPTEQPSQSFATSRPFQTDPTASNHQSMSPDNWGNSGPSGADPFTNSQGPGQPSQPRSASLVYGHPPAQHKMAQNTNPGFAGEYAPANRSAINYESTGAPSVKDLVGGQSAPTSTFADRVAPPSPFRPTQFDSQDPRDITLAPTVPSSILDGNDNRLDLPSRTTNPSVQDNDAPSSAELFPAETMPQLQAPVDDNIMPEAILTESQPEGDAVEGNVELPTNPTPGLAPQTIDPLDNSFLVSPGNRYPQTTAPPVVPTIGYPETTSPPVVPTIQYPQTTQPPVAPLTQSPVTPYRLPQVFETTPSNTAVLAPATVVGQDEFGSGFGWGNAPSFFQRGPQAQPALPPQHVIQPQQSSGPSFPLPFGLGSKLFKGKHGKRIGFGQSRSDTFPPDSIHSAPAKEKRLSFGGKKQVDPNTYPPQPISPSQAGAVAPSVFPAQPPNAQFRPDLGQRSPLPTVRNRGTYDSGHAEYDFENKKREFPPFSEILATGRWFGSVEAQFVQPRFNGNSGLAILDQSSGANFTDSQVFDFDFEFVPSLRFGFESKYGPGFEFDYRSLGATSDTQSFTSGAATTASLRAALPDVSLSSVIATTAPGQTLAGNQILNFESFGFSVFKEVQLPVTRINGMFGFQAIDIDHVVNASVADGAGTPIQTLNSRSDMRAFGPRLNIEYYRPVGHTRFEFLTRFGGSLLFGKRDQRITGQDSFQRLDTDEIVTTLGFLTALQIKQKIGENRAVFGRIGYMNESFNGGGSGFLAQDDFGLRGVTFLIGVNR